MGSRSQASQISRNDPINPSKPAPRAPLLTISNFKTSPPPASANPRTPFTPFERRRHSHFVTPVCASTTPRAAALYFSSYLASKSAVPPYFAHETACRHTHRLAHPPPPQLASCIAINLPPADALHTYPDRLAPPDLTLRPATSEKSSLFPARATNFRLLGLSPCSRRPPCACQTARRHAFDHGYIVLVIVFASPFRHCRQNTRLCDWAIPR